MANWKGGYKGDSYNREEFRAWLRKQPKPTWAKFITVHNSGAPYTLASSGGKQRMLNLANYYKNEKKWSGGPHGFVMEDRFYPGTPINMTGTHSPSWNGTALAIEAEGDFRTGKHDPKSGKGAVTWDTMAWVFAEILEWMGWEANNSRIMLHREDGKTTHACPGNLVQKGWFIDKVKAAMGKPVTAPTPAPKPIEAPAPKPVKQIYPVKQIQERLLAHGYKLPKYGADGIHGAETHAAIIELQTKLGVAPSGLIGPWVWEQLLKPPPAVALPDRPDRLPEQPQPQPPKDTAPIVAPEAPIPNPQKAMRLLQGPGVNWPKHWAAGAVAQAQRESYPDLRPWAQGDWMLNGKPVPNGTKGAKPTAFTIWQLRNDRWDNYLSWAEAKGKPWDDFETQVLWAPHELKTSEKLAWSWLQKAETVEQANAAMVWFERPKGYVPAKAKAATTWKEVIAVSEKVDGYDVRLKFAKALM